LWELQALKTSLGLLWCFPFFGFTSAHWNPVTVPEAVYLKDAVCFFLLIFALVIFVL